MMSNTQKPRPARNNRALLPGMLILAILLVSGCRVQYVADYDAQMTDEILVVAKEINLFWDRLLETPATQRDYEQFREDYRRIESDLRNLVLRNEIRPMNELSTTQARNALALWQQDRELHRDNDGFSDFEARRHRDQFARIFVAMATGEEAKGDIRDSDE